MKIILALCALQSSFAFVPANVQNQMRMVNRVQSTEEESAEPVAEAPAPAPAAPAGDGYAQQMKFDADEKEKRILALPGMSTKADLVTLQAELCPAIPFWDPLQLAEQSFWDEPNEATIGFLRQAEIKHGRVAMAGFVGFLVHANGIRWPFPMTLDGQKFPTLADVTSPVEFWDKIPEAAKWQIILFVGALEWWDEYHFTVDGETDDKPKHYMRGGLPGKYPEFPGLPLNLFDPFGFTKKMSDEQKAKGRLAEINNGRLAMIGMFGFISEAKVPGSVPSLKGLVGTYNGNIMVPFESDFTLFENTAAKIAEM